MELKSRGMITVIEFDMLEKKRYFPLTLVSGFCVRGILYPFTLIKTRLQVQKGNSIYRGTFHAIVSISQNEGFRGLYRGFWVNSLTIPPSLAYIATYEGSRHYMRDYMHINNRRVRSFFAGASASIVGQTLSVPVDVVSQHLMLLGSTTFQKANSTEMVTSLQRFHLPDDVRRSRMGALVAVIQKIYQLDGLRGFYKGYVVSLLVFAPNSALWWCFYDTYCDMLASVSPVWFSHLAIQCMAAPLGGISAALVTNPLDVVRARMQVDGTLLKETVMSLWYEERYKLILKGLTARLIQSVTFSFFIILGYESIKRWSLLDEYKHLRRW